MPPASRRAISGWAPVSITCRRCTLYFLAAAETIAGSPDAVRIVQALLGTAAVGFVFLTADEWFGRRAAWIAAVLTALTGELTFYEIVLLQSALDPVLAAAALLALAKTLRGAQRDQARWAVICGVVLGLAFLNRPNVIIAAAVIVIALLAIRRFRAAAMVTLGLLISLTPIVTRNALVSRQFALSSSQGGLNFYIGNHAGATGQYVVVPGVRADIEGQIEDTRAVAETAVGHPLSDAEVSSYFTQRALTWMAANPAAAGGLLLKKFALVFNARHQWLDFSYPYYAYDLDNGLRYLFVGPWLLVPLGLVGLFIAAPSGRRRDFIVWGLFIPGYALAVALFFVAERYRLPLLVALAVTAGGAGDAVLRAWSDGRSSQLVRAGTIAALAAIVTFWPFRLDSGRLAERIRLAKTLLNGRDYPAAAEELQRAHDQAPTDATIEFELGMVLVSAQRPEDGILHVRHALGSGVSIPGARYALIDALLATGDRAGAARELRTYHPAPEDTADSCYQVGLIALQANAADVAVE